MSYNGLINIGNTCYLNSGLQLLLQNKELCYYIVNKNDNKLNNIILFVKEYLNKCNNKLNPSIVKNVIQEYNRMFIGYKQHDSFEFILYFLDYIHEHKIKNIYEITTTINIKCKLRKCLNISSHNESHNFLLLDINNESNSLNDCYINYIKREKLMDDNVYYCEKCKANRIASKRINIIKWPNHLIIVLKRFNYNSRKIDKQISMSLEWNQYELQGFVFHSGSCFGGHYIYIGKYNNKWLMLNDDSITEINLNILDKYKDYAYIYYYKISN